MFVSVTDRIVIGYTRRYAKQVKGEECGFQASEEEYFAFFGIHILMAINDLPSLDDYWKRDEFLRYSPIADRIPRDRFRYLSRYLHFANNETLHSRGTAGHDRLGKVRPVIDHMSQKFAEVYNPHMEVSVDEAMIKFQGRSSLKQYMPKKPVKRGIKVWVLGDAQNGYFTRFDVYTGKKGDGTDTGLATRVVTELTNHLHNKYHHVFFDNFFTSVELLTQLEENGVYGCGTARTNRKQFPTELKNVKLNKR